MTSLETSNFQFPLFAAGDVTSWLVDFNGAMRDIDTALAAVKTTAETAGTNATAAQGSIAQINQQLISINNSISSINTSISQINNWTNETVTMSIGNFNRAVCYLNSKLKLAKLLLTGTIPATNANTKLGELNLTPFTSPYLGIADANGNNINLFISSGDIYSNSNLEAGVLSAAIVFPIA